MITFNDFFARKFQTLFRAHNQQSSEQTPLISISGADHAIPSLHDEESVPSAPLSEEYFLTPWRLNPKSSVFLQIVRWPIIFLLWTTIPDVRTRPNLRLASFFVCILWIGAMSYVVAFMITVIGDTFNIPDSVMGLTFLAAGTSISEAVSSVIVTNQGHGTMAIANSIGSNTFDILLCLGLPWLIKSLFDPTKSGLHYVTLNSGGMAYTTGSLLTTLCGLYVVIAINRFQLDRKVGLVCLAMYLMFLIFATMVELNIFFPVNLPTCSHD